MNSSDNFEFDDLQGLLRFSHGHLSETCFMLLNITDAAVARQWLESAPITNAASTEALPETALQIAFSVAGLRALGLNESVIEHFSDEFIAGMAGDESRSRRLGDISRNAPGNWYWGGDVDRVPHILLLLYARKEGLEAWRNTIENELYAQAFQLLTLLPTLDIGLNEPFGFADGISQPKIDWAGKQSTNIHDRDDYSNVMAVGEVVLGYPNEYGEYTSRPLIDPGLDKRAVELKNAEDESALKDLGRNGAYLVLRQLDQDVSGFWQYLDKVTDSVAEKRDQLAASMVGRHRNGTPLVTSLDKQVSGISHREDKTHPFSNNHFTYQDDPDGHQCPLGAHIRRANPRTGDFPHGVTGLISRLIKILGFGLNRPDEDLLASTRFHRILRRGRSYGTFLTPEEAIKADTPLTEHGLQFLCLVANISRQFEFVQNAWMVSSKFSGVQQESDPLSGHRVPLLSGEGTAQFNRPNATGPMHKMDHLPQFITVRGGAYFFMPGLSAIRYFTSLPANPAS